MTDRISGKQVADRMLTAASQAVSQLPGVPTLAVILVGDDPASQVYVNSKITKTKAAGMRSLKIALPATTLQEELEQQIKSLAEDDDVDGILLQLPLPDGLDTDGALGCIPAEKDVDGLTEANAGKLALGKEGLRPCTPLGTVILAKEALGNDLSGLHVVIVGRSILVGKPAAQLFLAENCTVTIAHSRTKELESLCRTADILVAAVGRPEMITKDFIKQGSVVLDVGINRVDAPERGEGKTRLTGDVCYADAVDLARAATPVPGGVGPMTIACLLQNTIVAACRRRDWSMPLALT